MHIVLTDVLTCPRCGPSFPLILLANRVENRRVLDGVLGCANCREKYPVQDGLGKLRVPFDDGAGVPPISSKTCRRQNSESIHAW